jgi:adenosine deaminase
MRPQLDTTDLSEIARNSVLMSGFPDSVKREWLGKNFKLPGYAGNDLQYTNVPNIRVAFRSAQYCLLLIVLLTSLVDVAYMIFHILAFQHWPGAYACYPADVHVMTHMSLPLL